MKLTAFFALTFGAFAAFCAAAPADASDSEVSSAPNYFNNTTVDGSITSRDRPVNAAPKVVLPPNTYLGATSEICNQRQTACMETYVIWKVNQLKLYDICQCATHIWAEGCKRFGYDDCTVVTDVWDRGAADVVIANAASVDTPYVDDTDTEHKVAARAPLAPMPGPGTIKPHTEPYHYAPENPDLPSHRWECEYSYEMCKQGWVCKADPKNCELLCNCYVGIWDMDCYIQYGYGTCVHGERFQSN